MATRSPLKETDANLKHRPLSLNDRNVDGPNNIAGEDSAGTKKRALERLDLQDLKRTKVEKVRSIEGAVKVARNTGLKNAEAKVTPNELLEWQNNWKKIMKRESRIYFDSTDEADSSKHLKNLDKRKDLLKRGFLSLGAQITQFFDCNVTIVITRRSTDNIHLTSDSDILSRAKKSYMKIWGYDKAARFLKNLDVDLDHLENSNTAPLATPTLSNLLQNEKLYGPTDRDPRTRREDVHYFKYAHIYMYDLWQIWAPIITLEWKPQELADSKKLPYPVLKMGTFGRCPFIGDGSCDESSYKRVIKRYNRDKANKTYALKLKRLYQNYATTCEASGQDLFIPHTCLDSKQCYETWKRKFALEYEKSPRDIAVKDTAIFMSKEEQSTSLSRLREEGQISLDPSEQEITQLPAKMPPLTRQETDDFPNDLCDSKQQSRIPQEIKASGAHQSNDVATSFGNGLGPTTASVTNKNIKTLNRLVVDRRLGAKTSNAFQTLATQGSGASGNNAQMSAPKACNLKGAIAEPKKKKKTEVATAPITKKEATKNAGYCENCRVKYDCLEQHILSERHQSFAQNSLNFEAIDSLIEKLKFQF